MPSALKSPSTTFSGTLPTAIVGKLANVAGAVTEIGNNRALESEKGGGGGGGGGVPAAAGSFETVTIAVPAVAIFAAGTVTVHCVKVHVAGFTRATPFHFTTVVPPIKLMPSMVSVKSAP